MTIRLLATYDGFPPGSIITIDPALEAAFIAAGNASANLAGGVVMYRERHPLMIVPNAKRHGTANLVANRKVTVPLAEGTALTITPTAGTTGTYQRYDASGGAVGALTTIGASALVVGPFEGDFTIEIKCTTGSLGAKVGDAVLNTPAVVSTTSGVSLTAPDGTPIKLPSTKAPRRCVAMTDSRDAYAQRIRAPGIYDGRPWFAVSGIGASFGIGLATTIMDSGGNAGAAGDVGGNYTGTLASDATGKLRWTRTGDTPGQYTDVSAGGWFYLASGTNAMGLLVGILASTPITPNVSVTVTSSGFPGTWEWDARGPMTWLASYLGEAFQDYQVYGLPGAKTSDLRKTLAYVFAQDVEALIVDVGVNDISDTASTLAEAQTSIAEKKLIIDYACARARRVYVAEIAPASSKDAAANKWIAHINNAIHAYCLTKPNVRFISTAYKLVDYPSATGAPTGKTGVYADGLHYLAYGGYVNGMKCRGPVIGIDYPPVPRRQLNLETWDSTLLSGSFNANPSLRGSGGTYGPGGAAASGITGVAPPDGWRQRRTNATGSTGAGTQVCVNSVLADPTKGQSLFAMTVSGAASGDRHEIDQLTFARPTNFLDGEYFRLVARLAVGGCSGGGLAILTAVCSANNGKNSIILHQLQPGAAFDTFTNEFTGSGDGVLELSSEPQKLLPGATTFSMTLSAGAFVGTGVATVYVEQFYTEKCAGPAYP